MLAEPIPLEYTPGTEELIIYLVDGRTNGGEIRGSFGIDNHLAFLINSEYRYGAYSPMHFYESQLPFTNINLGTLKHGVNAIQILRGDQYGWAGGENQQITSAFFSAAGLTAAGESRFANGIR